MKKFLMGTVGVLALGFATSAGAADMGARAPVYTKAPAAAVMAYNWTGFYLGGNVGGVWARSAVRDMDSYAAAAPAGTETTLNTSGFMGGLQAGYNWQTGSFVLGLEADLGYLGMAGDTLLTGTASGTRVGLSNAWYGDVTARVGLAFNSALLYAKGGWAIMGDPTNFSTVTGSFSRRTSPNTVNGWTLGAGVEWMFAPNWSAKAEYQYFRFNDANYTVFNAGGTPFRMEQDIQLHTAKVGVNYHFGGPVVAKY